MAVVLALAATHHPAMGSKSVRVTPSRPAPAIAPRLLATAAPGSDAFDDWVRGGDDNPARFLASDDAASGAYSLLVHGPPAGGAPAVLDQVVPVSASTPLRIDFNVKSSGGVAGAVRVVVLGTPAALPIPGGAYGWRALTVATTVPARARTVTLRIVAAGPTSGVRLDDFVATSSGSAGVVVQNPGFERNSADLSLTNPSLVFPSGTVAVNLITRRAPTGHLRWRLLSDGHLVQQGVVDVRDWRARFATAPPPGYYTLSVSGQIAQARPTLTVPLVVVPTDLAGGSSAFFGVGMHLLGRPRTQVEALISDVAAIGVRAARLDAPWAEIERVHGKYVFPVELDSDIEALRRHGIRPLLVAGYENPLYDGGRTPSSASALEAYARYTAALAAHYPGVDLDVWNEYDLRANSGSCGRSPACYLRMLRPSVAKIHIANPNAVVSAPSTAGNGIDFGWLQGFLAGGGAGQTDVVSVHPYLDPAPPDRLGAEVDRLQGMIRSMNRGVGKPIWFTEIGWSTIPGGASPDQQADDLTRTAAIALGHGVLRVYWYDALDDSALPLDRESNFGLFERPRASAPAALIPKPAVFAEALSVDRLSGAVPLAADTNLPPGVVSYRFSKAGQDVRVIWSNGPTARVRLRGAALSIRSVNGEALEGAVDPVVNLSTHAVIVAGTVTGMIAG